MPARLQSREETLTQLAEVFRSLGYSGTSMQAITKATGLGKGSLYHAFPGGKAEMAQAVLDQISQWFEQRLFAPLGDPDCPPAEALATMLETCCQYFQNGGRICLVGAFALNQDRDPFQDSITKYFSRWQQAISDCLVRGGHARDEAEALAEETLSRLQGALLLSRSLNDSGCFQREVARLKTRLCGA